MYAIIKTGGKQYRAEAGSKLRVEKLEANPGDTVEFDALLLGGEKTVVGSPTVPGAKVVAEVVERVAEAVWSGMGVSMKKRPWCGAVKSSNHCGAGAVRAPPHGMAATESNDHRPAHFKRLAC